MASIGHFIVGVAAGRRYAATTQTKPWRVMLAFGTLGAVADLDVLAFALGIPYAHPWGHRGASHSLAFALLLALLAALLAWRVGHRPRRFAPLALLTALSHPLLDAITTGGLGVALLWPLDHARIFAPWAILPVAPIGRGVFSLWGLQVLSFELLAFSPLLAYALWPRRGRAEKNQEIAQRR